MPDLITADIVIAAIAPTAAQQAELTALIPSVCRAVERFARRGLLLAPYDETHRPGRSREIRVKNPPFYAADPVQRVCTQAADILSVWNDDASTPRATLAINSTTLTLQRYASGSPAASTFTLASYATANDLYTAIQAVGQGWHAQVQGDYGGWLVSDLNPLPGVQDARARRCSLQAHVSDLDYVIEDLDTGRIELMELRPDAFRYPDRTMAYMGGQWVGSTDPRIADVRVLYRGGFDADSVPADIQEACIQTVQAALQMRDTGIFRDVKQGNVSYTVANLMSVVPDSAKGLLSPWVRRTL